MLHMVQRSDRSHEGIRCTQSFAYLSGYQCVAFEYTTVVRKINSLEQLLWLDFSSITFIIFKFLEFVGSTAIGEANIRLRFPPERELYFVRRTLFLSLHLKYLYSVGLKYNVIY